MILQKVIENLLEEEKFKNFEFKKTKKRLIQKTDFGFRSIDFYQYSTVRDNKNGSFGNLGVRISPVIGVKFNILSKWFEKFSFKSLSDQRNNYTLGIEFSQAQIEETIFYEDGHNFEYDYKVFLMNLTSLSDSFFTNYNNVYSFYQKIVFPKIEKNEQFPDIGSDWIFEYLAATKICDFSNFEKCKKLLNERIDFLKSRNEPNVLKYDHRFTDIFEFLKNLPL